MSVLLISTEITSCGSSQTRVFGSSQSLLPENRPQFTPDGTIHFEQDADMDLTQCLNQTIEGTDQAPPQEEGVRPLYDARRLVARLTQGRSPLNHSLLDDGSPWKTSVLTGNKTVCFADKSMDLTGAVSVGNVNQTLSQPTKMGLQTLIFDTSDQMDLTCGDDLKPTFNDNTPAEGIASLGNSIPVPAGSKTMCFEDESMETTSRASDAMELTPLTPALGKSIQIDRTFLETSPCGASADLTPTPHNKTTFADQSMEMTRGQGPVAPIMCSLEVKGSPEIADLTSKSAPTTVAKGNKSVCFGDKTMELTAVTGPGILSETFSKSPSESERNPPAVPDSRSLVDSCLPVDRTVNSSLLIKPTESGSTLNETHCLTSHDQTVYFEGKTMEFTSVLPSGALSKNLSTPTAEVDKASKSTDMRQENSLASLSQHDRSSANQSQYSLSQSRSKSFSETFSNAGMSSVVKESEQNVSVDMEMTVTEHDVPAEVNVQPSLDKTSCQSSQLTHSSTSLIHSRLLSEAGQAEIIDCDVFASDEKPCDETQPENAFEPCALETSDDDILKEDLSLEREMLKEAGDISMDGEGETEEAEQPEKEGDLSIISALHERSSLHKRSFHLGSGSDNDDGQSTREDSTDVVRLEV